MPDDLEERARGALKDFDRWTHRVIVPDVELGVRIANLLKEERKYDHVHFVNCFLREPKGLSEIIRRLLPTQHVSLSPSKRVAIVLTNLDSLGTNEVSEIQTYFTYPSGLDIGAEYARASKVLYLDPNPQKYKDPVLFVPGHIGIITEEGIQPLFSRQDIALGYAINLQELLKKPPISPLDRYPHFTEEEPVPLFLFYQRFKNLEEAADGLDLGFMDDYGIKYSELKEKFQVTFDELLARGLKQVESKIDGVIDRYKRYRNKPSFADEVHLRIYQDLKNTLKRLTTILEKENHPLSARVDALYARL